MAILADTLVLLDKELRTEFRSRELLTTTVVFILVVVVLFSFTFDPSASESQRFGIDLATAAERVNAMSDEEVRGLSRRIDSLPAGGSSSRADR